MTTGKPRSNLLNALLYSTESISALLFSLVTIALIARHFGPEFVARYNVAQAVSAMLIVVATLGLDQFIIRDLARNPRDARFASSAQAGMLIGWLVYSGLTVGYFAWSGTLERDLVLVMSIVVYSLFLRVLFIKPYLQALNQPKAIALASVISRIVAVGYLVAGSLAGFSFNLMMLYLPVQAMVMFAVMLGQHPQWLSLMRLKALSLGHLMTSLREAWPVFLATGLYFFYSQSDVLMMSNLLDANTVGVYSAAIRLVPLAAFIGFSILAAFYTELERRLALGAAEFDQFVRSVLAVHFGAGLVLALGVTLSADLVIRTLYGARFAESAAVLKVACWAWVFMMPAALLSRLLIMLNLARYELIKMLLVAPVAVGLNYLAITRFGTRGAALMCVIAYLMVDLLVYAFFKPTRRLARLGLGALSDTLIHPVRTFNASLALLRSRH